MRMKAGDHVSSTKGFHSYLERELIDLFPDLLGGLLTATSNMPYCSSSCGQIILHCFSMTFNSFKSCESGVP